MKMKNFIRKFSKTIIISFVTLLLTLFLVTAVNKRAINDLEEKLQTTEIELEKAEETLEEYRFHLRMLNRQRGQAMRAYEELRKQNEKN